LRFFLFAPGIGGTSGFGSFRLSKIQLANHPNEIEININLLGGRTEGDVQP